jgi:hypothetical protein
MLTIPVALPETELRRGRTLQVAAITLTLGDRLELRSMNLHLLKILTTGVVPVLNNTAAGLVSVGVYATETPMVTGGCGLVHVDRPGMATWNASAPARFVTPGTYRVLVSNNASNVDLSIIVSGSLKWIV